MATLRDEKEVPQQEAEQQPLVDTSFLPCCIRPLFHNLIGFFIFQADDFGQLVRKVCALSWFVGGGMGLAVGVFFIFLSSVGAENTELSGGIGPGSMGLHVPDLIIGISFFVFALWLLLGYLYVRVVQRIEDSLVLVGVIACLQLQTCFTFFSSDFDERFICTLMIAFIVLNDCPLKKVLIPWPIMLQFASYYNRAFEDVPGAVLLRHPEVRHRTGVMKLQLMASAWLPMMSVFFVFQAVLNENKRQVRGAKKSVEVAEKIVQELRKYNTDNVKELVLDGQQDSECNKGLMSSFEAMVQNLERYRPFLPNYLFLQDSSSEEVDREEEDEEGNISAYNSRHNAGAVSPRGVGQGARLGAGDDSSAASSGGRSRRSPHSFRSPRESGPSSTTSTVHTPIAEINRTGADGATTFRGRVSYAWIHLKCNEWFSTQHAEKSSTHQCQRLAAFTDTLFEVVRSSTASIHSLLGDTVQLTWNATHRVAQPEVKAAGLLLKLKEALALVLPHLKVVGACCTGVAEVHSIFSAATKQQALYLDASWLPALEACLTIAKKQSTIIVDANTEVGANFEIVAQGVDCICYQPQVALQPETNLPLGQVQPGIFSSPDFNPVGFSEAQKTQQSYSTLVTGGLFCDQQDGGIPRKHSLEPHPIRYTLAFELIRRKAKAADDEWMYQLQVQEAETEASKESLTTEILRLVVAGKFGEATEVSQDERFSGALTPAVRSLLDYCHSRVLA